MVFQDGMSKLLKMCKSLGMRVTEGVLCDVVERVKCSTHILVK